jgi:HEPN domain-containing protein/predicted nucleotidyltransferase
MKRTLTHLPKHKQDELETITNIILEKIPDVRMIILFGSYARGNWVEDIHKEDKAIHIYESDFDILVATKTAKQADSYNIQDAITKAIEASGKVKTPYSIIYHAFGYINKMITEGHYFFGDIKKEGIHLYRKSSRHSLGKAKSLTPAERKQIAEQHFDQWFKNAKEFYGNYEFNIERGWHNKAAFMLHQATESLYSAITLVFVNYRFRTHDIEKLGRKAARYDAEFAAAFPLDTDEQKEAFNLLKKAYVDARYKDSYEITKEQLEYLAERVKVLQELTKKTCGAKIESFV